MLDLDKNGLTGASTQPHYNASEGVRLESVGDMWAAYSPLSGETQILNDESAAILEWLLEVGMGTTDQAASALSEDAGMNANELAKRIQLAWAPLASVGLIQQVSAPFLRRSP